MGAQTQPAGAARFFFSEIKPCLSTPCTRENEAGQNLQRGLIVDLVFAVDRLPQRHARLPEPVRRFRCGFSAEDDGLTGFLGHLADSCAGFCNYFPASEAAAALENVGGPFFPTIPPPLETPRPRGFSSCPTLAQQLLRQADPLAARTEAFSPAPTPRNALATPLIELAGRRMGLKSDSQPWSELRDGGADVLRVRDARFQVKADMNLEKRRQAKLSCGGKKQTIGAKSQDP